MTQYDDRYGRIERADRLAEHERSLAAKEAELAIEQRIRADSDDPEGAAMHRSAASMHEQAKSAHEQAAEFQKQHADELRAKH
jgi:hypothetical protein